MELTKLVDRFAMEFFLGVLDLLSEFDPLLASHIAKYANKGRGIITINRYLSELTIYEHKLEYSLGRASYLSDTICDEFIALIRTK